MDPAQVDPSLRPLTQHGSGPGKKELKHVSLQLPKNLVVGRGSG